MHHDLAAKCSGWNLNTHCQWQQSVADFHKAGVSGFVPVLLIVLAVITLIAQSRHRRRG